MALSKTISFKGITVNGAYLKVWHISGGKTEIKFGLGYFASADGEMFDSKTFEMAYDINGENPIKQAYEYLKSLPEFADAGNV
jgi:hypothetical protein